MQKTETVTTFLGKDTEFEGKLTLHGTIRIDGHFKGEISADGSLIVGKEAMIEATMHISYISISGEIHGNIIADDRIEIHSAGKVFGDIQAPTVVINEGGIFEGNCQMQRAKEADASKLAVVE
jgi:cytoskeletal protein CcmA (bactofilin family)